MYIETSIYAFSFPSLRFLGAELLGQGECIFKIVVLVATSPLTTCQLLLPPAGRESTSRLPPCWNLAISHCRSHSSCRRPCAFQGHSPGNGGQGVGAAHGRGVVHCRLQLPCVRAACRKGRYRSQGCGAKIGSWLLATGEGSHVGASAH